MAILLGGAMREVDRAARSAERADDCIGFLALHWHEGHDGGDGEGRFRDASVEIAEDTPSGQFELYFCSTACLRSFFGSCVDALEARMRQPSRSNRKRGARART